MMHEFRPENVPAFVDRFWSGDDAVLRYVGYSYALVREANVVISVQDVSSQTGWSNIHFRITGVKEFLLREGKTSCVVLSSGLRIGWLNGSVALDFSPVDDTGNDLSQLRQSDFFVIAESCLWRALPYSDIGFPLPPEDQDQV